MRILRTVGELRAWRRLQPRLGLVPTMGALHEGHLDLLSESLRDNRATVLSIFVNPSQFSPSEDLDKYPRTFDEDIAKFRSRINDIRPDCLDKNTAIFAPSVSEMYPSGIDLCVEAQRGTFVEVLGSSHQLEGSVRPHFFRGVATIVTKLFNAVQPDRAYFGQKDIQQYVVVRQLARDLLMPTEILMCPTHREPSGLAMSSRNEYLDPVTREKAAVLYRALCAGEHAFRTGTTSTVDLQAVVHRVLRQQSDIIESTDYVSVNDLDTFNPLEAATQGSALSAAVRLKGGVRILDNIVL